MKKVAVCILRSSATSKVWPTIGAMAGIIIGSKTNGVINVNPAILLKLHLFRTRLNRPVIVSLGIRVICLLH